MKEKKAIIFTGQGSQKFGMGKDLYDKSSKAKEIFENANDILGERFSDRFFSAGEEELMDPRLNQIGIFVYETALVNSQDSLIPDYVAGHSLGEYAALVRAGVLSFEETVKFLKKRGEILYNAFQNNPSAMGAVIGIDEETVKQTLDEITQTDSPVYIANYNGPGQVVITGQMDAIKKACKVFKEMGAKRALRLPQKGFGHSPNSQKEGDILAEELKKMKWQDASIPIFQDVDGKPHTSAAEIRENQIKLMTHPVQWTTIVKNMVGAGVKEFYECGPDDTLQKIVKRMYPELIVDTMWNLNEYRGIEPYWNAFAKE